VIAAWVDLSPIVLSFQLAFWSFLILFPLGIASGFVLLHLSPFWKKCFKIVLTLPWVLPPSVLGFYFLLILNPNQGLGKWLLQYFNLRLVFSFEGIVVATTLFSLPFFLQPLLAALENLPSSLSEAAYTLGKTRWQTYLYVLLPSVRNTLFNIAVLTFAHSLGEFGLVLMIGGNIPTETRVASIAIFSELEALHWTEAHIYSTIMLVLAIFFLAIAHWKITPQ